MKRAVLFVAGVLTVVSAVGFAAPAEAQKSNVTVKNSSDWEIHEFYLSSSEEAEWGPDQLGEDVIGTGESFTLRAIPCDTYDVMLVDEDGDECIVEEVELCGSKETWTITNKILLGCQAGS